ncbi:MAG TPA: DUF1080 domain-containing protein [Planctomycetaceae bacterium]|jgi:hypothetical protein|nr:DUF1080 domain-containing protein [Planctomycetaceae bacterium]
MIEKNAAAILVAIVVAMSSGGLAWIASVEGAEFRSIFNGHDLAGWSVIGAGAGEDWLVRDGCLVCQGKHHSWLRSSREYGDFRLVLEYQVAEGANSGVYVHVPADGNHHRERSSRPPAGFEIQILDDHASRYAGLKDYQYSASLYDIAGALPRVSKPAGEWNTLEIQCVGLHVSVIHNGVRVVDARPERFPLLALRNRQGYLGLQSHNGVVRFRNLKIECLEKTAAGSTPAPSR